MAKVLDKLAMSVQGRINNMLQVSGVDIEEEAQRGGN
jgi:hypothetical protein